MTATAAERATLARRIETAPLIPTEHDEQRHVFAWAALRVSRYPELALMFAIPNGGARHIAVAKKLRAEGVKAGVPDICLPVARQGYCGLFIEMKRRKGGTVSAEQRWWHDALRAQDWRVEVCRGCVEAIPALEDYLCR